MSLTAKAIAVCVLVIGVGRSAPAAWTWERLEYPGATDTYANGIWGSTIVGTYAGGTGIHGFVYDGTDWTTLDYPGSYITYATGIWQSKVVGHYTMSGWQGYEAGFLYDGQTWQTLAYPGAMRTRAQGVYENRVVGYYVDADFRYHGFLYDGTGYKSLDYPDLWRGGTLGNGIYGDTIVGTYWNSTYLSRGFVYDGQSWASILPAGAYATALDGISGELMVGRLTTPDQLQVSHSFLLTGSTLTYIDCPWGYDRTLVAGVSGDRIVGTYRDTYGGPDYSFVLTMPEPTSLALLVVAGLLALRRPR